MAESKKESHLSRHGATTLDLEDLLSELRARATAAQQSQERISALLDAVVAVSADLELSEVLGRIVASACALVDCRYGALGVLGPDGEHLVEFITYGISAAERVRIGDSPRGHGVLGLLIRDPKPRRMREISEHAESYGFPPHHPPMHTFLGTPIRIRDEIYGNLYMAEKLGAAQFTSADEATLVALAAAAGVAIENARLYDLSQRQRRWSQALGEVTQTLLESDDEDAALNFTVAQAAALSSAAMAAVALYDDGRHLVLRALHVSDAPRPDGDGDGDGRRAPASIGTVLQGRQWDSAMAARQPLLLLSPPSEPPAQQLAVDVRSIAGLDPAGAAALLPIVLGPGDLGVLLMAWDGDVETVTSHVLPALTDFAQHVGLAFAAASSQRDRARAAMLEDRHRIARDMHDHVIQRLFATGLSLQSVGHLVQHPTARNRIEDAVDELDDAIKDIRKTIFGLQLLAPAGGLSDELQELVETFSETLGFTPDIELRGPLSGLSHTLAADVLAVVREGLANVARHAHAGSITITITSAEELDVMICDDGIGMSDGVSRSGLANLKTRAAARSGSFAVSAGAPRGTVLRWRVPVETVL